MKILISSIACCPGMGSEAKVGWDAVLAIAENHECHVITHSVAKESILAAQCAGQAANVTFHFYGENYTWHPNRLVARMQSWLIYRKWQSQLLDVALDLHRKHQFDVAHHLTYATWRVASPLWKLPIPFVWGPIGGTATMPVRFWGILSPTALAFELLRVLSTTVARHGQGFRDCVKNSAIVIAANEETEKFLKRFRRTAPINRLPVAFFTPDQIDAFRRTEISSVTEIGPMRLFAGGNIEGRKGVALALKALARLKDSGIDCLYTISGGGPEINKLISLANELGVADMVEFHAGFTGQAYRDKLKATDIYFMPSFRETTPITLLEAILSGCYPVVADASAAGEIVRKVGGHAVSIESPRITTEELSNAILWGHQNRKQMRRQAELASVKVRSMFSQTSYVEGIESAYKMAA